MTATPTATIRPTKPSLLKGLWEEVLGAKDKLEDEFSMSGRS